MNRVLKNYVRKNVKTVFRGREITFRSKASKVFNMNDEEEAAEYHHWRNIYQFIEDITERLEVNEYKI